MVKITVGKKYNMLFVLSREGRYVNCLCDCGNKKKVRYDNILSGMTKACGCLNKNHRMRNTRIYRSWSNMVARCDNKNLPDYKNYGGRGITYDKKRKSFVLFYEDMKDGYSDKLTIDRVNNDGNYCKENCRWATAKQQANNKRPYKKRNI